MEQTIFITGADRGLGLALSAQLVEMKWRVFAGQFLPDWPELQALAARFPSRLTIVPLDVSRVESAETAREAVAGQTDHLDVLINNAGVYSPASDRSIREVQDFTDMHRLYDINALGALRVTAAFLPLLDRGTGKRLCFVSSEAGSITRAERKAWFGYCMSKAALNMGVKILFNDLRPQGYTFRVYHPGWIRSYMHGAKNMDADMEPEEAAAKAIPILLHDQEDENELNLKDYDGKKWPW